MGLVTEPFTAIVGCEGVAAFVLWAECRAIRDDLEAMGHHVEDALGLPLSRFPGPGLWVVTGSVHTHTPVSADDDFDRRYQVAEVRRPTVEEVQRHLLRDAHGGTPCAADPCAMPCVGRCGAVVDATQGFDTCPACVRRGT